MLSGSNLLFSCFFNFFILDIWCFFVSVGLDPGANLIDVIIADVLFCHDEVIIRFYMVLIGREGGFANLTKG